MTSRDTPAQPRLDSFRKILNLEESKGFKDTAVVGGLDRFLELHALALTAIAGDDDPSGLVGVPYRDLTPSRRKKWVNNWLVRLADVESPSASVEEGTGEGEPP